MKFFNYWARESQHVQNDDGPADLALWRGSNVSVDDARARAREALAQLVARFKTGQPLDRYAYSDRPLREEIVDEIADGGEIHTVLTRNSYGSLVLNSSRVMFIDIDEDGGGVLPAVKGLFSMFSKKPAGDPALENVRTVAARHPDLSMRVYRTFKGLRCLVTHQTFEPGGEEARRILEDFGSDPLYVRLCSAQDCFRARLTAKHWRIGASKPPVRYPFANLDVESTYRAWQRDYEEKRQKYAACQFLESIGPGRKAAEVESTIRLHDEHACSSSGAALA